MKQLIMRKRAEKVEAKKKEMAEEASVSPSKYNFGLY